MASAALLLLLLLPFALFSETLSQTPAAPGPINITGILAQGGQFSTFIRLLDETKIIIQLQSQLNSSTQGMTILAPTDNGFNSLKPGALNALNDQQKTQLLLYHVLTRFYTLTELQTVSNPTKTLVGDWGLNITSHQGSQVNISTGVITVQLNNTLVGGLGMNFTGQGNQVNVSTGIITVSLREQSLLSVFAVDQVLLPKALFGSHIAAPPSKAPTLGDDKSSSDSETTPKSDAAKPPSNDKGASVRNDVTSGLVLGFGLIVIMYSFLRYMS